ncbi:hypothetical protein [Glycomyces sp. NPDC048151]|uniref:hypothetical protein n=1 Tax=Glycomyces sp. NPDC048151 TaxID=3364002 RepID=UPI00371E9943
MEAADPEDADTPAEAYSVRDEAYRILREINPYYDDPEQDPNHVKCEGPCCNFRDEFWV